MPTLHVSGTDVSYQELGAGETIVMVHAGGNGAIHWRLIAETLSDRFRVVMPEMHGHGDTPPWTEARPMQLDDEAEVVEAFCKGSGPVHLVGHSFGGAIASRVAIRARVQLRSVVLIEPMLFPLLRLAGQEENWRATWERRSRFAELHRRGEDEQALREWVEHYSGTSWQSLDEGRRRRLVDSADMIEAGWCALSENPTSLQDLQDVLCPVRIIIGTSTTRSLRAASELAIDVFANAEAWYIEGGAHMTPLTHPDEVANAIASMASRHGPSASLLAASPVELYEYEEPGRRRLLRVAPLAEIERCAPRDSRWLIKHPDPDLGDAHVRGIAQLLAPKRVPGLSLAGCRQLSGTSLEHIAQLEHLEILDLFSVGIDDDALAHLSKLKSLVSLDLSGTYLTDAASRHLGELSNLRELHLGWTDVGDRVVEAVARLPNLAWLDLSGTRITSDGLRHVGNMSALEHLTLRETSIDDEGLRHLGTLGQRLASLDVGYTRVDKGAVEHLKCLQNLRRLVVRGTRIPAANDPELLAALPRLSEAGSASGLGLRR
jgi:pimeloyl-ACP methyl ester carboxylesterase